MTRSSGFKVGMGIAVAALAGSLRTLAAALAPTYMRAAALLC
jgi:hypothetical protein